MLQAGLGGVRVLEIMIPYNYSSLILPRLYLSVYSVSQHGHCAVQDSWQVAQSRLYSSPNELDQAFVNFVNFIVY